MPVATLTDSQRVLILHAGGLGDLVLSMPALASLRAALDGRRVTLCCRSDFAHLTDLWPFAFERLIEIDFDPYMTSPLDANRSGRLDDVLQAAREEAPDTLLSLELAPTWLTPILAALTRPRMSLARKHESLPPARLSSALELLGLSSFAYDTYDAPDNRQEAIRYASILEILGVPAVTAGVNPCDDDRKAAEALLGAHALQGRDLLGCFPLGNPHVLLKHWPLDRHVAAISTVAGRHHLMPLLFGNETERDSLQGVAARLRHAGSDSIVFAGNRESWGTTAALLARCSAFFGNDTGLAHLAAALGTPGVTVYGGGTWPSFEPWASGTIGIVNPLPCFGCGWDCAFASALCLEAIEIADSVEALERALSGACGPKIVALQRRSQAELDTIASASSTYRVAQADRRRRYDVILDLQERLLRTHRVATLRRDLLLDAERRRSQDDAERSAEIAALKAEIKRLHRELDSLSPGNRRDAGG
jgi:ADP-heptose:LPS heptosyltransferase